MMLATGEALGWLGRRYGDDAARARARGDRGRGRGDRRARRAADQRSRRQRGPQRRSRTRCRDEVRSPPASASRPSYRCRKSDSNRHSLKGKGLLRPPSLPFLHSGLGRAAVYSIAARKRNAPVKRPRALASSAAEVHNASRLAPAAAAASSCRQPSRASARTHVAPEPAAEPQPSVAGRGRGRVLLAASRQAPSRRQTEQ